MGTIATALRMSKAIVPRIINRVSAAPRCVARILAPKVIGTLLDLFDTSDDATDQTPQWSDTTYNPNAPKAPGGNGHPVYNVMTPNYTVMAGNPAPAPGNVNWFAGPGHAAPRPAPPEVYVNLAAYVKLSAGRGHVAPPQQVMPQQQAVSVAGGAAPGFSAVPKISLMPGQLSKDQSNNVKYITDVSTRFQKYEVNVDHCMQRRGAPFDTEAVKTHFYRKPNSGLGMARLGAYSGDTRFDGLAQHWGENSLIWVCVMESGRNEPVFYSHVGKYDRFHHSSFTAGGDVICAGEWIVDDGHLRVISANSGHYRPPIGALYRAILFMAKALQSDTEVLLWNAHKNTWENVPVQQFKANPTAWKTHPRA